MFTPEEIESIPLPIEKMFNDLQLRVMTDVVRRLKNVQDISASADYQMSRLYELGKSKKEIQTLVAETLDKSNNEIDNIFSNIIQGGYARDEHLYTATGKDFIAYKDNKPLQQLVKAMRMQTKDDCYNITQSMGFAVKQPDGKLAFKPIAKYYQDMLDRAVVDITSGMFDYNTVLNRTVSEMTNSGLRTVDYASGHSNRLNVAARRAVMTGVRQFTAKISEDNAEKLETEYFEVSWHRGARPSHQEFQGKVYSRDELVDICGLGTVEGLCGANCYHGYDAFIPGVSERKYTDEWLAEQNAKENTPIEYNGKEYTLYEATQHQRRLESAMRAQREKIRLLESGNADEDSIIAAKARYFKTSDEYVRFSKVMDLPQQRERVSIDGNGIIKSIKLPNNLINKNYGDIIHLKGTLSNRDVRKWYIAHDNQICDLVDKTKPIEEQARQACELRNTFRTQARDLMLDQEKRKALDISEPNRSFEELINDKMQRKNLSYSEAVNDVLKTASKTRKSINKKLGLEE